MVKAFHSEDDSAEIDELLEEQSNSGSRIPDSPSRYKIRVLRSYNDAHAKIQSHTSIMHTEESKGSPFLLASDQEGKEEKAPHADNDHAGVVFHDDASKCASLDMPHTPPSKSNHPCETRRLAVDKLPSPPPSPPPFGCSCFFLTSPKKVQKQRKFSRGEFKSSKIKAKDQKAKANDDDNSNDWGFISNECGLGELDEGGLFDVKKTEREFKRVSLKEKQLSKEAQKLLDTIASS